MHTSMDDSDEEFDQLGVGPDSELEKVSACALRYRERPLLSAVMTYRVL